MATGPLSSAPQARPAPGRLRVARLASVGRRGASSAILFLAGAALAAVVRDLGPFHRELPLASLLSLDLFLAALAVTALLLAAAVGERQRTEEALGVSEARYRLLADHVGDMISRHDLAGNFLYASPAATAILGHTPDELLGRSGFDVVHPDDVPRAREVLAAAVGTGSAPTVVLRVRRKDGSEAWVETKARLLAGGPAGDEVLCATRDITERKRLEEQFRQAQKMEAIGRLAGGVAHDFNNLLTVINGTTELLLTGLPGDDPARAMLQEVGEAGARAAGLTRQLLAFSRRQMLALSVVNLNDVVGGMEKMLCRLIGEDVRMTAALAADLRPTRADVGQLEQVLMNLAVNARDAMPDGGELRLATANVDLGVSIDGNHFRVQPGPYVVLAVTDTGCGMDEATRAHLFEPFFTTKEPGRGTGLGLATVYGIVKQSEGYITVDSVPGRGTTFKIYLPRAAAAPPAPLAATAGKDPGGREVVLLVEDDDAVRSLAGQVLGRKGYHVLEACDGRDALRLWRQGTRDIDLLLTDVVMPHVNGRELADRLTAERPDLKVLFLSGYTDDAILRHGVLDQDVAFLQKPFTTEELAGKVREVLDGARV